MAETDTQEEEQKNVGGRPLKFQTVEELDRAIQNYFAVCDPHETKRLVETGRDDKGNLLYDTRNVLTEQKPYTMTGLARALDTTRETLLDYASGKYDDQAKDALTNGKYSDSIAAAKLRCAEYAESHLFTPGIANGAKFALVNNYGFADKQEIDHTSKGKAITAPAIITTVQPRDAKAETETTDGS